MKQYVGNGHTKQCKLLYLIAGDALWKGILSHSLVFDLSLVAHYNSFKKASICKSPVSIRKLIVNETIASQTSPLSGLICETVYIPGANIHAEIRCCKSSRGDMASPFI